jgi:GGDEF domain-containing protein
MMSLRRSFLFLIAYLAAFLNIERLDFSATSQIHLSPIMYLVCITAIVLILIFPVFSRQKLQLVLTFWLAIYLILRLVLWWIVPAWPIWGGINTYLTIAEMTLLTVGILLALRVANHLEEFTQAVQNITLGGASYKVQPLEQAYDDIQREFLRSQRHHYPLSVIVVEPDPQSVDLTLNRSVTEIQQSMMTRYVLNNIIRIASELIRRTDMVIDQATNRDSFVVFSTDTSRESAELVKERIRTAIENKLNISVRCGLATFPEDGRSFEELVQVANDKIITDKHALPLPDNLPGEDIGLLKG